MCANCVAGFAPKAYAEMRIIMKKIAIINQRYGLEVNGGSELYSREIAERLKAKYEVEVLTSCAVEYVKWSNYYKEGVEDINGVTVRRFKTEHERIPKIFSALDSEMLSNPDAPVELSDRWIEHMGPYCPQLVEYVDEHQDEYEAIIVVTYLYYTAVKSIVRIKDKAIYIPTAHHLYILICIRRCLVRLMLLFSLQMRRKILFILYSTMKMYHMKYVELE